MDHCVSKCAEVLNNESIQVKKVEAAPTDF